ncbi:MAG: hypothetical protein P8J25_01615 [Porticoccaceae bacterium]|nr:hypothetical protein [Porticoccaceae bacterium]
MRITKTTVAILLSLLLGLSTTVSAAHSHDGHHVSDCVFAVVQSSETSLAQENSVISLPICNQKQSIAVIGAQIAQQNTGFFARAPPSSL